MRWSVRGECIGEVVQMEEEEGEEEKVGEERK
jgi:hypothetical protein